MCDCAINFRVIYGAVISDHKSRWDGLPQTQELADRQTDGLPWLRAASLSSQEGETNEVMHLPKLTRNSNSPILFTIQHTAPAIRAWYTPTTVILSTSPRPLCQPARTGRNISLLTPVTPPNPLSTELQLPAEAEVHMLGSPCADVMTIRQTEQVGVSAAVIREFFAHSSGLTQSFQEIQTNPKYLTKFGKNISEYISISHWQQLNQAQ
jgi:hypothetical protein